VARMLTEEDGIPVFSCGGRSGWDFRVLRRLTEIVRTARPDLLHTFLFHANFAGRWAARRGGIPVDRVICEIQTVEVERRWHLRVDRWTHRGCRLTVGNSPSVIDHLAVHAGIPQNRLLLIRGGIDPEPLRRAVAVDRTMLGLKPSDRIVLWVGRLDPVKGLRILIDSFVSVVTRPDVRLLLVGGGPLLRELTEAVAILSVKDRVMLLGPRTDVPSLLRAADVFVFPSRTEGLPNALMEAMAAALPIVATDVPGCRDLIRNRETGLLVPYGDTQSLAAALGSLLDDRVLAAQLGRAAQREVTEHWHLSATWAGYARLYAEALAEVPARMVEKKGESG